MAKRHNGFSRLAGSTYVCDCCSRRTRNTGSQSLGSMLCPQCFDLAGIENEISDGYRTEQEATEEIRSLVAEIRALGGKPELGFPHWASL